MCGLSIRFFGRSLNCVCQKSPPIPLLWNNFKQVKTVFLNHRKTFTGESAQPFKDRSDSPQLKQKLISDRTNFAYELPRKLPDDLSLKILENYEMFPKSQIWVKI